MRLLEVTGNGLAGYSGDWGGRGRSRIIHVNGWLLRLVKRGR